MLLSQDIKKRKYETTVFFFAINWSSFKINTASNANYLLQVIIAVTDLYSSTQNINQQRKPDLITNMRIMKVCN